MSAQNLQTVPCAFLARRLVVPACQACDSKIAQSSLAELGVGVAGTARYCSRSRLPARGRLVGRDGIVAEAFGNARVENASSSARAVGVQEVRRRGRCRARSSPTFPENAPKSGNSKQTQPVTPEIASTSGNSIQDAIRRPLKTRPQPAIPRWRRAGFTVLDAFSAIGVDDVWDVRFWTRFRQSESGRCVEFAGVDAFCGIAYAGFASLDSFREIARTGYTRNSFALLRTAGWMLLDAHMGRG